MLEVCKDGNEFRVYEHGDIVAIIKENDDMLFVHIGDLPVALSVRTGINIQHYPSTEVFVKQPGEGQSYEIVVVSTVCTDVIYMNF